MQGREERFDLYMTTHIFQYAFLFAAQLTQMYSLKGHFFSDDHIHDHIKFDHEQNKCVLEHEYPLNHTWGLGAESGMYIYFVSIYVFFILDSLIFQRYNTTYTKLYIAAIAISTIFAVVSIISNYFQRTLQATEQTLSNLAASFMICAAFAAAYRIYQLKT